MTDIRAASFWPTCEARGQPGVDPETFPTEDAKYDQEIFETFATYPHVASEPPLKCYVTASCPPK
jgi:hypothetical protein